MNHKKLEWINYVPTIAYCNMGLPTLIIGWENYKRIYGHIYPNILQKRNSIDSTVRWEFSMEEKMVEHFNGVEDFIKTAPREYCNLYKYVSIDPIKNNINHEYDVVLNLESTNKLIVYKYKDEILYLLDKERMTIYGVYLNSYKYFKYDTEKIINILTDPIRCEKTIIDSDGSIYQQYYKHFPEFDQLKRSIVLFCS
jgi:hypothetical protein